MKYTNNDLDNSLDFHISKFYKFEKRIFDIIISLLLLIISIPIILILCVIVRLESKGSPIYVQKRVGINNKEFNMYKIRSMVIDAEANGAKWADKNDSRVTKVGNFIRKTRLDELPQLFNILKGDMTFIGPRPERKFFYDKFREDIPDFEKRILVKPGLTGYAQVNGGYDVTPEEKLKLDLYYIKNLSIKLDLNIMFKTINVVFTGEGAR